MEKKEGWKRELDDLLEDYWGYPDGGTEEGFIRGEMGIFELVEQELDKAREEGRREVYEAIVFDENIPHDITTFVAANLWKNMRDKAKEELSKLKDNK